MKEKLISKWTDFSRIVLYMIAVGLLIWLNIHSFRLFDVVLVVLLVTALTGIGIFLERAVKAKERAEIIVLGAACLVFWGVCIWWVSVSPYEMSGDQAIIWTAAKLATENDFSMYKHGGQMFIYPQQQGLALLYEILFRITGNSDPDLIGYINASLAPFTLFFGYQCVKECSSTKAAMHFLPMMMLCLPYIIYSPYLYGDIPSVCYSFIVLWAVLKFTKTCQYRYAVLACLIAALALTSRMNIWIFFIGVTVGMIYFSAAKWSWKPIALALSMMLCASLTMGAVKEYNSSRSGYPVSKGMPSILWMTMGFQYSEWGAGYYNNYSKEVFESTGFDRDMSVALAKQEIKDRAKMFLQYPEQITMFFGEKLRSQWHDPLFEADKSVGTYVDLKEICSAVMFMIYIFSLIGAGFRFFKKKELIYDIPLIVFVGGFLFSIIWEAKSRYMLPYYVFLHMYAAYGLTDVTEWIRGKLKSSK